MRYPRSDTILCGFLEAGRDVTIKLIDTKTDTLLNVTSDVCAESQHMDGLYYFDASNITDTFSQKEIVFVMTTDRGQTYSGKIVIEDDLVQIPAMVWSNPDRNLTVDVGLSTGEHEKLMVVASKADIMAASQL